MNKKLIPVFIAALILAAAAPSRAQDTAVHKGKVTATMDSGGYTYVEFEENGKKAWAASQPFKVAVGDMIEFSGGLPMESFTSKSLNRTFPLIYFAGAITKVGAGTAVSATTGSGAAGGAVAGGQLPAGHMQIPIKDIPPKTAPAKIAPGSIAKADGGFTIAEIYAKGKTLNAKSVKVRGRVVKFMADVMGRNWLHIQDGTGGERSNDLTVTTSQTAAVGDLVLVAGTLAADKDFGSGYAYTVIVEGATVKVEEKATPPVKTP
jgi:hypothetical protein